MTEFTNDWILKYSKKGFFIKSKNLGVKFRENERDFFINVIMNGDIHVKYDGYSVKNGNWYRDKKILKVEGEFAYSKKMGFVSKSKVTEIARQKLKEDTFKYTPSKFSFAKMYKSISNRYYINLGKDKLKFKRYEKDTLTENLFYNPGDFTFVEIDATEYEKKGIVKGINIARRNARDVLIEEIDLNSAQLEKALSYYIGSKNVTGFMKIENYNQYSLVELNKLEGRRLYQSIITYENEFYFVFGSMISHPLKNSKKIISLSEEDDRLKKIAFKIEDIDSFMINPYDYEFKKEELYSVPSKNVNIFALIPII